MKQRQRIGSWGYGSAALIAVLAASALLATSGCTLITDIDRNRINSANAQGGADAGNASGSGGEMGGATADAGSNGGSSTGGTGTGGTPNGGGGTGGTGGTVNDASAPMVDSGAGGTGGSAPADSGVDAG